MLVMVTLVLTSMASAFAAEPLVVGSTTKVLGQFFTGYWGNNTSDIDVRTMIHGYNPVVWDSQINFVVDTQVVKKYTKTMVNGNTRFTVELANDLVYNDGKTKINAKDYVFSILLSASKQAKDLGADATKLNYIVGFEDYNNGKTNYLKGLKLVDEYKFSIDVKKEFMPFFYELSYMWMHPYPISVIAPGCKVAQAKEGAYIANEDENVEELAFTKGLLAKTLFDETSGYMNYPKLTSGPYKLVSYDKASGEVVFEKNKFFKGDFEGVLPRINNVKLVPVYADTMLDKMANGEVQVINKLVDGLVIDEAKAEGISTLSYDRLGYAYLDFSLQSLPTYFKAVRQAIAYSIDAKAFTKEFTHNYGTPVFGYYGVGQWMYKVANGEYSEIKAVDVPGSYPLNSLNNYDEDIDKALDLLVKDGWTLNEEGKEFNPKTDSVRYKQFEGELIPLVIKFAQSENNEASQLIVDKLKATEGKLGIRYDVDVIPFTELLEDYYKNPEDRVYNMNFMATNYKQVFDPSRELKSTQKGLEQNFYPDNANFDMINESIAMRNTAPMDLVGYMQHWYKFQKAYNEFLPTYPLYSNVYYDLYDFALWNYNVDYEDGWPHGVYYAEWMGEE